ncbi:arginine and alanine rich protein, partial [Mycobacterium tuberculosis BTB07-234]
AGRHHQPRGDRKPRAWRQCGPQNGPRRSQAITPEPGAAGRHHQPRGDRKPRAWRQCGPQNGPRRSQAITPEPGAAGRHWLDQRPVVPDGVGKSDS